MTTAWNDKKLGFGLMRLPKKDGQIDIPAVCGLVDTFLAAGFTYFDTAYAYDGAEIAFREAVAKRYPRESFTVASKMFGKALNAEMTPEHMFAVSLERCGVEYFDFYLLHTVKEANLAFYDDNGCWDFCLQKKREGKIRSFGFSFHGTPALLERLLTLHPEVDFVQLQINYTDMDDSVIAAGENYEICRRHGKDIVVMEPVKGGILASVPPKAEEIFRTLNPNASPASYALRFAASLPGVKTVLSGMNTSEQMQDNTAVFGNFVPLSESELAAIAKVKDILLSVPTVACTDCRYCTKGCPMSIRIPDIIRAYNLILTFGDHSRPHLYYGDLLTFGSGKASDCVGCGQCESVCPQHLPITRILKDAAGYLDR